MARTVKVPELHSCTSMRSPIVLSRGANLGTTFSILFLQKAARLLTFTVRNYRSRLWLEERYIFTVALRLVGWVFHMNFTRTFLFICKSQYVWIINNFIITCGISSKVFFFFFVRNSMQLEYEKYRPKCLFQYTFIPFSMYLVFHARWTTLQLTSTLHKYMAQTKKQQKACATRKIADFWMWRQSQKLQCGSVGCFQTLRKMLFVDLQIQKTNRVTVLVTKE